MLLTEQSVPVGILKTIYSNIFQCQIVAIELFTDCCSSSILGCCFQSLRIHWIHFWKAVLFIFVMFAIPTPFYIRLVIYYSHEYYEIKDRKDIMRHLGLKEMYNNNLLQYLTPSHPIFIACYFIYFIACILFGLCYKLHVNTTGTRLVKRIIKHAFVSMNRVKYLKVLEFVLGIFLIPLKKFGIFGCIVGIIYWPLVMPVVILAGAIYCLPTCYLTVRMMYNAWFAQQIRDAPSAEVSASMLSSRRPLKDGLLEMKNLVNGVDKKQKDESDDDDDDDSDDESFDVKNKIEICCLRSVKLLRHIACVILCLTFIYGVLVIMSQFVELLVQMCIFTLMGIIVNAGIVLRYISLLFLVVLYSYDCYNSVYKMYLALNKHIITSVYSKIPDVNDLTKLPSSKQKNTAFKLNDMEHIPEDDRFKLPNGKLAVEFAQLVLFVDKHDTPRIPKKLFDVICDIEVGGSPGPVYKNMIRATGRFLSIIIFLIFVFIVVMTFGEEYKISSTNQMLATLAGGFVPFMLRNFISPSAGCSGYTGCLSWKNKFEEALLQYRQKWPLSDLIVQYPVQPTEGSEADEDEGRNFVDLYVHIPKNMKDKNFKREPFSEVPVDHVTNL